MGTISYATVLSNYLKWLTRKPRYVNDNAEIEILVHDAFNSGWKAAILNEDIRHLQEQK